jgi:hypothetical protein
VDIAVLESGAAVAAWIEHSESGGQVRLRRIEPGGTAGASLAAGPTSVGRASGSPRVVRAGDGVTLAWTDTDEERVKTAAWRP